MRYIIGATCDYYQPSLQKKKKNTRSRRYLKETTTDTDYADDLVLLVNGLVKAESQLNNLVQEAGTIGHYVNANYNHVF